MKIYKPYLSLSKTAENYLLEVVFQTTKTNCITSIVQEEIEKDGTKYWGVVITVSDQIQIVNGPEEPIISTSVTIDLDKSEAYKTVKCVIVQSVDEDLYGPAQPKDTDIDFGDS